MRRHELAHPSFGEEYRGTDEPWQSAAPDSYQASGRWRPRHSAGRPYASILCLPDQRTSRPLALRRMDPLERWRLRVVLPFVRGRLLDLACGYNNLVRAHGC